MASSVFRNYDQIEEHVQSCLVFRVLEFLVDLARLVDACLQVEDRLFVPGNPREQLGLHAFEFTDVQSDICKCVKRVEL